MYSSRDRKEYQEIRHSNDIERKLHKIRTRLLKWILDLLMGWIFYRKSLLKTKTHRDFCSDMLSYIQKGYGKLRKPTE